MACLLGGLLAHNLPGDVCVNEPGSWVPEQLGACAGSDIASEDSLSLKRQQSFQLAKPSPVKAYKKGEVAGLIAAFVGGFAPAQRAMVNANGLPKLTRLLISGSLNVQDKGLSALLVSQQCQHVPINRGLLPQMLDPRAFNWGACLLLR